MSDAALAAYAQRLRNLKTLAPAAAKEAAPLVGEIVRAEAAAGVDPNGQAWHPKKDGTRALPNAASAITAVAIGVAVIVRLTGAYVFHHYAKGAYRRRILPDSGAGVPPRIADALRTATAEAFRRAMR